MTELLVCPLTKGPLRPSRDGTELVSEKAKLAFPIREGVAILLPSEARRLSDPPVTASFDPDGGDPDGGDPQRGGS